MKLTQLGESATDERTTGRDTTYFLSDARIEYGLASYGTLGGSDAEDRYTITPGIGTFALYVTIDPANGLPSDPDENAYSVHVRILTRSQELLFDGYNLIDAYTNGVWFTSQTNETLLVTIDKSLNAGSFSYIATLQPLPPVSDGYVMGTRASEALGGTFLGEWYYPDLGDDTVMAGEGNDVVDDPAGRNYLRGEDGADGLYGGGDFDDLNGNAGNDTCSGRGGDDWVVGGKGDDAAYGGLGNDIVYGNLGDDTLAGGAGDDLVRGGQQNDVLWGGSGNDWLSGDLGDDTLNGGAGSDTFNVFGGGGHDIVEDFNAGEGDRVRIEPGWSYLAAQVGGDTVITFAAGGSLTLSGVTLSKLPSDWLVIG